MAFEPCFFDCLRKPETAMCLVFLSIVLIDNNFLIYELLPSADNTKCVLIVFLLSRYKVLSYSLISVLVTAPLYFGISFNNLIRAFKIISFLITIPKGLFELELFQIRGEDPLAPNTSI